MKTPLFVFIFVASIAGLASAQTTPQAPVTTLPTPPPTAVADPASPLEKVAEDYFKARADAIKGVNDKYAILADGMTKLALKEGDLPKANAIDKWGKTLSDPANNEDRDETSPDATGNDRLAALQAAYLKERETVLVLVDKTHLPYVENIKHMAMADGDLDAANHADLLLKRLNDEIAQGGAPVQVSKTSDDTTGNSESSGVKPAPSPGAPFVSQIAAQSGGSKAGFVPGKGFVGSSEGSSENLFTKDHEKKWEINRGEWTWEGNKLIGKGDSEIEFPIKIETPFTVQFKINIVRGSREKVMLAEVGLHNVGYVDAFGPEGGNEDIFFKYQRGKQYRVTIAVNDKGSQFYVDGKVVADGWGCKKGVKSILLWGGDWWSKGEVEYEDFMLYRGTDKIPNP